MNITQKTHDMTVFIFKSIFHILTITARFMCRSSDCYKIKHTAQNRK